MEDAILGNSKGATYKSFILDVEIVIKKEGIANVSEGKVKNKNTKGNNEGSQETGRKNVPNRNVKQDVFVVNAGQTNLREINNRHENNHLGTEKSKNLNKKYELLSDPQKSVSNDNIGSHTVHNKQHKHLLSNEANASDTSSEKQQKKKKTHKTSYNSKVFKGKIEPVDFLECNRIFMCNYLQLPKQNSDSALFCNYFGAINQILHDKFVKNAKSVDEITSILKQKNNIRIEPINKKLSLSSKDLGNMYSKGDSHVTNNIEIYNDFKKPIKQNLKSTSEDMEKTDRQSSANICNKSQRDRIDDLLNVKEKCYFCKDESIKTEDHINVVREVVDLKRVKNNYSKTKKFTFFQRFKNIKRNLFNPSHVMKKTFKKSEKN